jgi:hypothetical protein
MFLQPRYSNHDLVLAWALPTTNSTNLLSCGRLESYDALMHLRLYRDRGFPQKQNKRTCGLWNIVPQNFIFLLDNPSSTSEQPAISSLSCNLYSCRHATLVHRGLSRSLLIEIPCLPLSCSCLILSATSHFRLEQNGRSKAQYSTFACPRLATEAKLHRLQPHSSTSGGPTIYGIKTTEFQGRMLPDLSPVSMWSC